MTPSKPQAAFDLDQFEVLLDRHGSDLQRWPEVQRMAGAALLLASSAAQRLLFEARQLDDRLAQWPNAALPDGLRRRVLLDFERSHAARGWIELLREQVGGFRLAVPALAAALVLGFVLGQWIPAGQAAEGNDAADALALMQYSLDDGEW